MIITIVVIINNIHLNSENTYTFLSDIPDKMKTQCECVPSHSIATICKWLSTLNRNEMIGITANQIFFELSISTTLHRY